MSMNRRWRPYRHGGKKACPIIGTQLDSGCLTTQLQAGQITLRELGTGIAIQEIRR